ncbi:MAG TPA: hypothetical protein VGG62_05435 [Terracidiphilus sp.]
MAFSTTARPQSRHDLFLADERSGAVDQYGKDVEGARADRYRDVNAAFVTPRQTLPPIEAEVLEQENLGRGEHAHASRLPAYTSSREPRCRCSPAGF